MNHFSTRVLSAFLSICLFLFFICYYSVSSGEINEIMATVFWLGMVGLGISIFFGIPFSYLSEWLSSLMKNYSERKKQVFFVIYNVLGGSIIPVFGNIVAFLFSLIYVGMKKQPLRNWLILNFLLVSFLALSILSELHSPTWINLSFYDDYSFIWCFLMVFVLITFSVFFLKWNPVRYKWFFSFILMMVYFFPFFNLFFQERQEILLNFKNNPSLEDISQTVHLIDNGLVVDGVRSFINGVDSPDLTIYSKDEITKDNVSDLIKSLPLKEEGYHIGIYHQNDFLELELNSHNKIVSCFQPSAATNLCKK